MSATAGGPRFVVEALGPAHGLQGFDCAVPELNGYLRRQAGQDSRRNCSSVFVATRPGSPESLGFYTLSMATVGLELLPADLATKLPRYPELPAVRLGRLAVARAAQGQGLGQHLLLDAIWRALHSDIAWFAMIVDAKDPQAAGFYRHFGFQPFAAQPLRLFVPRQTLEALFQG